MTSPIRNVVVVGAGLSGLVAAYRLKRLAPETRVTVLEAASRPGGVVHTDYRDGFVVEQSADSILREPSYAIDLANELGLETEIIGTNPDFRGAYVVRHDRLHRIPAEFRLIGPAQWWPLITSSLLSWPGKLRACLEPWVPVRQDQADESFQDFVTRRYGHELFEYLAQPLVSGIYNVDPAELSMQATLSRFVELERKYGSVSRGLKHMAARLHEGDAGIRYGLFFSFRRGLQTLVDTLSTRLGEALTLNATVTSLEHRAAGYVVHVKGGGSVAADAVILALGADAAASLVGEFAPELAAGLSKLTYGSSAVVSLAFDTAQLGHPLDAFGIVVPRHEGRASLAVTFSSVKYLGRAPQGKSLVRVYFGESAAFPHTLGLSDTELAELAHKELDALVGVKGHALWNRVHRLSVAIPQYKLGHVQRIQGIEHELQSYPDLALAGNYLHGIGIPHVVHSAEQAAQRVFSYSSGSSSVSRTGSPGTA